MCRKLRYPLPATTFSRAELRRSVTQVLEPVALSHSGIARTIPTALAYGPTPQAPGIGLDDLYVVQGIEHILRIGYLPLLPRNITGQLNPISLEALLLVEELGLEGPAFSHPFTEWRPRVDDKFLMGDCCPARHTSEFEPLTSLRTGCDHRRPYAG